MSMSFLKVTSTSAASHDCWNKVIWKRQTRKVGITAQKGGQIIKFDIRVETLKGVLWCAYINQPEPESKVAAGMIDNKVDNQTINSMKE